MPKKLNNKPKVYFSAPSINTQEQKRLFELVRNTIENLGYELTYDWISDQVKNTPKGLFKKALEGINSADALIAEVSFPSTGVGQQIAIAKGKKIPVIVLYLKNKGASSRFTLGSENDLLKIVAYNETNLKTLLGQSLSKISKERFERFNFISTPEINTVLESESEKLRITRSQLLRKIVKNWIEGSQNG